MTKEGEPEFDVAGFAVGARPLCPFCSAPWGDKAVEAFDLDAADHCQSGRFGPETCTISIFCEACDREMYRKEGFELR